MTPVPEARQVCLQSASLCYCDHAHHILAPPVSAVLFGPALLFLGDGPASRPPAAR